GSVFLALPGVARLAGAGDEYQRDPNAERLHNPGRDGCGCHARALVHPGASPWAGHGVPGAGVCPVADRVAGSDASSLDLQIHPATRTTPEPASTGRAFLLSTRTPGSNNATDPPTGDG